MAAVSIKRSIKPGRKPKLIPTQGNYPLGYLGQNVVLFGQRATIQKGEVAKGATVLFCDFFVSFSLSLLRFPDLMYLCGLGKNDHVTRLK